MGNKPHRKLNLEVPEKFISIFEELGDVNLLNAQIENNPEGVVITNTQGNILYVNKKMSELSGYNFEELIGKNPSIFKSGVQPKSFYDRLWESIRAGEKFESRFKNKKKNGELYWVYSEISPLYNSDKEIVGFISIQEEITNLVKFENDSIDSGIVLQNLTKSLPNTGIILLNNNSREVYKAEGEIIQEFFSDGKPTIDQLFKAFNENNFNLEAELKKFCSSGNVRRKKVNLGNRTIDFNISPVQFSNSSTSLCLLVIRDVTYYQQIIDQVNSREKQLEAIFQNAGVGIAILDNQGNYLRVNNGWAEMIGYSRSEILKSNVSKFIYPGDLEFVRPQLDRLTKGDVDSLRIEARALTKDNSVLWGDVSLTSIKGSNREVISVIAVFVDITKNKLYRDAIEKSEKEYRELNAMKDKFFSIISHDLKNPFSNIIGLTDLALDNPEDNTLEDLMGYVKIINSSATQAFELLQNLLDWSRSQSGAISPILVHHDLYDIVSKSVDNVINMADAKKIIIENYVNSDQWIVCDFDMIYTVLRNLLTNAIKFSHEGSKIEVSSEVIGKHTVLSVKDFGVGMSDEFKDRVFDITNNVSSPGTNNEKGTGLGLVLVNDFVKQNNGELTFESALGKGTTFSIKLPNLIQ
jgi:PAS domain S-box-containing protein